MWNTPNPASVGAGSYKLIVTNAAGCRDTASVTVRQNVAVWTGSVNTDWNVSGNWDILQVPDSQTHAIIPSGTPICNISGSSGGTSASIQVGKGATLQIGPRLKLNIATDCKP